MWLVWWSCSDGASVLGISEVSFLEYLIYALWSIEVVIVLVCVDANENCFLVVLPLLNRWDEVFDELGSWV